ncbi:ABC transporter ATP-binding protein [Kurthia zopfii]|uniref:ABC transport system ATP-binding protein n=1 Tax=Kurthia zopfii TaxID=1650 RepID=A0A8B4QE90_9BACL|nr:ABC transporter ATP-binding protein [Kurthia zopfii]PWI22273.1 peptide ABC transporter ATP-binding protein [Kurthia zopfii]TDR37912.1 putative ABC transport system ATP-binding protein [Kurthia zopfii]GEK30522.1 ABC transporter ATP-binding protein [Kurthia zopfii]STX11071.1 Macrolide export ATP-binding/permease protein MacB [Kurthia zopfii]
MKKLIEVQHLSKVYPIASNEKVHALKDVNFTISEGDLIAIVGTSGSGKSTLLRILGCIDTQSTGQYLFKGLNIEGKTDKELANIRNQSIGFVMQDFSLIEDYSVKKNVLLPLTYEKNKVKRNKRKKNLNTLLEKLNMSNQENQNVTSLSGGQKQRVAIARALINQPAILLADEPTGALDQATSKEIMSILHSLHAEGKTIIIVTHDLQIAEQCQRIFQIEDGHLHEVCEL